MPRGNPDNLRAAAARKSQQTIARAEQAIRELIRRGQAVNFRAVAREARCSEDFLYRNPDLRPRIEHLRAAARPAPTPSAEPDADSTSNVVRALTQQIRELKSQHHREVTQLREALATAHGELLELRRRSDVA
jgi:hypothetical protein